MVPAGRELPQVDGALYDQESSLFIKNCNLALRFVHGLLDHLAPGEIIASAHCRLAGFQGSFKGCDDPPRDSGRPDRSTHLQNRYGNGENRQRSPPECVLPMPHRRRRSLHDGILRPYLRNPDERKSPASHNDPQVEIILPSKIFHPEAWLSESDCWMSYMSAVIGA